MNWIRRLLQRWGLLKKPTPKLDPVPDIGPEPILTPQPTPTPQPEPVAVTSEFEVRGNRFFLRGVRFVPVVDTAWMLTTKCGDPSWYMAQRKAQGFNGWQCGGGDQDDLKPAIMDRLIALAQQCIDSGMVPFLGFGFVHYIDGKPQDHGKGREREVGRVFARAFSRLRGPYAVYCNGLDDRIEPGRVIECAAGFREINRTAPLGFHALHGVWARPSDDMVPIYATTQSGDKDLTRENAKRLVMACNPERYAVFAQEPCYEGQPQFGNSAHIIDAADVANAIAGAVDAGCAGVGYGHHKVWQFASGWQDAVKKASGAKIPAQQAKRI